MCPIKKVFFFPFWTHFGHNSDTQERYNLDTFYLLFFIYFSRSIQILKSSTQIQNNVVYFLINKRDNNNGDKGNKVKIFR